MKINKKIRNVMITMPLISSLMLTGCAGNGLVTPTTEMDNVDFKFIGIPVLLGMHGSAVRIDENWLLTARHNSIFLLFDELYKHPSCDIALIKDNGKLDKEINFNLIKDDESVTHKGYAGFLAMPSNGKGKFLQYLTFDKCTFGLTDAPIWSGMSGGAVYNSNNELVGINQSIIFDVELKEGSMPLKEAKRRSAFTPVCTEEVGQWIEKITGVKYCSEYKDVTARINKDESKK
ncbi:S1 family peptidase [Vibrio metschnikovii]|uniref:Trypsin-like peptidase domain-containing protein n=1 Tax=Vibrio metschnikovii TaxID=28172 RepID=A0A9X0RB21_VIBME|nr:serine protease [Vibrio metschnikovii]MBC5851160.1 trypsin-like peptidase domain-containing protein [Vibrio metschnikovii]